MTTRAEEADTVYNRSVLARLAQSACCLFGKHDLRVERERSWATDYRCVYCGAPIQRKGENHD